MAEPRESQDPSEVAYGLVMPFVACVSQGGPYEDGAFVAGYECGLIDAALARHQGVLDQTVRTDSVPQLDLIAMRHGWTMTATDSGTEGWSFVKFEQSGSDVAEEQGDGADERTWRDLNPADMTDKKLPFEGIEGPLNELGERCPWPWDPQQLGGAPLGQYHCPYCGGMQVAGMEHLDQSDTCLACLGNSDPEDPCPFCGGTGEPRHNIEAVPIEKMDAVGYRFKCSCGREGNGTHRTPDDAQRAGFQHVIGKDQR